MRVEVVVFPGFDELDALGPLEVLRNAARQLNELDVALVSRDGGGVTGAHGVRLDVDRALGEAVDALVVPGGGWNDRADAGVRAEIENGTLATALRAAHERGATVASVCTGAMLLAAAGLTAGRPATTHRKALEDLRASGAVVISTRVVDDGTIVTSAGVTAGLDLAFWLLERWFGPELAEGVADAMEYERRGLVWLRGRDRLPNQHPSFRGPRMSPG